MNKEELRYIILRLRKDGKNPYDYFERSNTKDSNITHIGGELYSDGHITKHLAADMDGYFKWGELTELGEEFLVENNSLEEEYKKFMESHKF